MNDILLIDGLCGLCTRSGNFLNKRLSKELEISELESENGKMLLEKHSVTIDSVVLIRNEKAYVRSAAAIRCLLYMKWNWKWLFPFAYIIPLPIRDLGYIIISKLRF
ncbi:MAG: DCC1-like thiol-disulfide oxidoreductase family protein [Euryarchaeota archaeon]|jgi:predicted DCC family thiol-disulfide oxidoreductase YuxK